MPYNYAKGRHMAKKGGYATYHGPMPPARRRAYGTAAHGYQRTAVRRMQGPPAALYSRVPTNALALKSVDMVFTGSVVNSTTATLAPLAIPTLGSAFFNRLSNRTRAVSLQLTGYLSLTGTNGAGANSQLMRIMIVYDRQSNGALPALSDLLLDTPQSGSPLAITPRSGLNINNRDRFMVLRDRKVLLPEAGVGGISAGNVNIIADVSHDGKNTLMYNEFIKLKGLESLYNSTNGGGIGDVSAGSFLLLAFDEDAAANAAWQFSLTSRLKFLD